MNAVGMEKWPDEAAQIRALCVAGELAAGAEALMLCVNLS
jgi:hypothetical protein